jgi:hypothetical protein
MKRLLDYNPLTGVSQFHHYDPLTKQTIIETTQDVTPILDQNKRLQNDENYSRDGIKNDWWHVATIPLLVQYQWLKEGIDIYNKDHTQKVRQKLDSPEYAYLRTTSGRIGKRLKIE